MKSIVRSMIFLTLIVFYPSVILAENVINKPELVESSDNNVVNLDEENMFVDDNSFTFNYDSGSESEDEDEDNGGKEKDKSWWTTQDKDTNDNTDVWQSEKINLDDI